MRFLLLLFFYISTAASASYAEKSNNHNRIDTSPDNTPVSYLFDQQEKLNNFSTAIHLPGFLVWGDVSLAAALSNKDVLFINPLTMSGLRLTQQQFNAYKTEYSNMALKCRLKSKTRFIN